MEKREKPNPNKIHPCATCDTLIYVKPTIKNPNVIVGDFTYFSDVDFESHIIHHYDFYGDRLIIGQFCQIAKGVDFVMNGANHTMNTISTYPFYVLGWQQEYPSLEKLTMKGDTVIGNDVWIGQNATILPGVHIGDGAIIGANSTVGRDVEPYAIVVGNPAVMVKKRFDEELIALLLQFKWWDRSIDEIDQLMPLLSSGNLEEVREELKRRIAEESIGLGI